MNFTDAAPPVKRRAFLMAVVGAVVLLGLYRLVTAEHGRPFALVAQSCLGTTVTVSEWCHIGVDWRGVNC
jgi:hypothetical protein